MFSGKGEVTMYFGEFLLLMVSAVTVTLVLMMICERLILLLLPVNIPPLYKIIGSFIFAIILISLVVSGLSMDTGIYIYLLSGAIILWNKYWLGHFSKENVSR